MKSFKILLPIMLIVCAAHSQNSRDSLDYYLNEYLSKTDLPGFSVIILNKDKPVYRKGFGYADLKSKRLFTPETIQNIGSVSKTFVAAALMKAIELNYFTLETDINEILPFKVVNPFYPNEVIRVKDLTTHTSGIIDNDEIYNRSYRFRKSRDLDKTLEKFMQDRGYISDLSDTTLSDLLEAYLNPNGSLYSENNFYNSKPQQRASYSNIGSALAAYLIEVKAGMSFAMFSEKHILKPLKMNVSSWFLTKGNLKQHSVPYFDKQIAFPYYSLTTYPDGGLRTSAVDLSKYVLEMMNGLNGKPKILTNKSVKRMFMPVFSQTSIPENMSLQTRNKGVFWNIYNDGYIGHDGDDPGVSANILFNKDTGIILLINKYLVDRTELLRILKKYGEGLAKESK